MKKGFKIIPILLIGLGLCSFTPEMPGDTILYFDSVDFTGKQYRNIHSCVQNKLGRFSQIDLHQFDYKTYIKRENWFFGVDNSYEEIPQKFSATYKFNNYIDLPIKIVSNDRVSANSTLERHVETIYGEEYNYSEVYSFAKSSMQTVSSSFEIGLGLFIDPLELTAKASSEVEVSNEIRNSFTYSNNATFTFQMKTSENIVYNNENNFDVYYQRCYRQRYELYFTNVFSNNIRSYVSNQDIWGKDYTNIYTNGPGIGCYFTFKAVDIPYFHVTEYKDNSTGEREVINLENSNVVFF